MDKKEFLKINKEYLLANGFVKRTNNSFYCVTSEVVVEIDFQHTLYSRGYYINCWVKPIGAFPNEDVTTDLRDREDVISYRLPYWKNENLTLVPYENWTVDGYLKELAAKMDKLVFPFIKGGVEYIAYAFDNGIPPCDGVYGAPIGMFSKIALFIAEYKRHRK